MIKCIHTLMKNQADVCHVFSMVLAFMVWLGVSSLGPTEVFFLRKRSETSALVYQNIVLKNIVEPIS